ncbi:acetylcholinesterase-like precursor [Cimex lectularius]|uniref:Carboxylic ester hydrolase n=1 Tax=Cimex lectularius TaxID=79782 RepID=G1K818_CIMLE|nr:acetylcholinesterase-like precursor [Cimex lectularius]ADE08462.1 salivary gland-specific cholinesterase 1 [Cimex lectularius]
MWWLLVSTLLISVGSSSSEDNLVVDTDKGKVQGVTLKSATGKDVDAWLGIPFAKPPTGNLRFKLPQPPEKWDDTKQATRQPNSCVQTIDTTFGDFPGSNMWNANTDLSEDCLYLNVIVPKPRPTSNNKAPVMLYIFGGGFYCGSATLDVYDPKTLASEENVIVVSIQHRVASLGFLYLGTEEAPGNMGLFDQRMAMKWVKDNIQNFGGDPNKITLFGMSSGASSIGLHLMAPESHSLFNNAILESGTAFTPWTLMSKEENKKRGLDLAKQMKCTKNDNQHDMNCLRTANATQMVYKEWEMETKPSGVYEFPFVPVVDSQQPFFKKGESSGDNKFKKTGVIMGSNKEEGIYFLLYFLKDVLKKEEQTTVNEEQYKDAVEKIYPYLTEDNRKQIKDKYKTWQGADKSNDYKDALDKMVGDSNTTCSVNQFADVYAGLQQDVYVYLFDRISNVSPWPKWTGGMHGEEIYYVFGEPLNTTKGYSEEDKKLSKEMMKYWANFARTGDPNKDDKNQKTTVTWPKYDTTQKKYLKLAEKLEEGSKHREEQCQFWKTLGQHVSTNELDTSTSE